MIVVFSNKDDQSTNEVIEWLYHFKAPFIRLNEDDIFQQHSLLLGTGSGDYDLDLPNLRVCSDSRPSVWYRRGAFRLPRPKLASIKGISKLAQSELQAQVDLDVHCATEAFEEIVFEGAINRPTDRRLNRLVVLRTAVSLGFTIPETLVTNDKARLCAFKRKHGRIVTKNIPQGVFINLNGMGYNGLTAICSWSLIRSMPEKFPTSLFQPLIKKWLDIRTYYLDGRLYSSAIFSQSDKRTQVDFRNYNERRPNRTPPFRTPADIEAKITTLMQTLNLRSGSIDMLLTAAGEYVFLEVNPIGQFKQVSYPCNYHIEKLIAETLVRDAFKN